MRGYAKSGVVEKIREAGGEIYAVTSEPQSLASRAQLEWDFGFESVGDPHQEITQTCRERGWLDVFVNRKTGLLKVGSGFDPQHPKGYLQPGVLALGASGRVLYRWRSVPTRKNNGGATERPSAEYVWSKVEREIDIATDAPDADFDENPTLDARAIPWPIFVALLVANGWFVRARPFPYISGGPTVQRRARRALVRAAVFAVAWVAALWWLPALWVAGAFALWVAWITPSVRVIHDEFQNEAAA